jgi:redox-regulated HSP33 family molecular chaperone
VTLRWEPPNLILQVKDNGSGISNASLEKSDGFGLRNMHTRASQIDGKLDIQTAAGRGTTVVLTVPISSWNPHLKEVFAHQIVHFEQWNLQLAVEDSFQLMVGVDVEANAFGYIVQDMAQQEQPGPDRPREESDAFSRQSKALNEIDEAIRSDEPAGEKLKKLVEEHSNACDEIKEELAGHKEGTMPQSSPLSE